MDKHTVYLTNEQIHRLAGLACDALAGIQFDASDQMGNGIFGNYVTIDNPSRTSHFEIDHDGTYRVTT